MKVARLKNTGELQVANQIIEYPKALEGNRNILLDKFYINKAAKAPSLLSNSPATYPITQGTDSFGRWVSGKLNSNNTFRVSTYVDPTFADGAVSNIYSQSTDISGVKTQSVEVYCDYPVIIGLSSSSATWSTIPAQTWTIITGKLTGDRNAGIYALRNPEFPLDTKIYHRNWKTVNGDVAIDRYTPAPEDLGLSYPDYITEFKPKLFDDGTLMMQEFIEGEPVSLSKDGVLRINEIKEMGGIYDMITDGLSLWYNFTAKTNSDPDRSVVQDLSGNANNGTLLAFSYDSNSGYNEEGLVFDGFDDVVRASNPFEGDEYTMFFDFIKYNKITNHSFMSCRAVLGRGISIFLLRPNMVVRTDSGTSQWTSTFVPVDYKRTKIAVVKTSADRKLYVDGILHSVGPVGGMDNVGSILTIGASQVNMASPDNYFKGSMANVAFYNRALSGEEVDYLSNKFFK